MWHKASKLCGHSMHNSNNKPPKNSRPGSHAPCGLGSFISPRASSQQQQFPQHPSPAPSAPAPKPSLDDPRLKWARPEWIKQPQPRQSSSSSSTPVLPPTQSTDALRQRQRMLNRVTYGSYSSSDEEQDNPSSSSSSSSRARSHPLLYQALGIDFGAQRVGIAVRRSSSNVPLLTLHREQLAPNTSSSSSSSSSNNVAPGAKSGQQKQKQRMLGVNRVAAAILQLALQEGCDGFVVGLPVYVEPAATPAAAAAAAASRKAGKGGQQQQKERHVNVVIRGFAQTLAELAAPLQLPVLLVNEQQSSRQARAVMSGAAAYDVHTVQQLAAADGQQQTVQQPAAKQTQQQRNKQQQAVGRDAFAAALILSRYYNGLVEPVEQLQAGKSSSATSSRAGTPSSSSSSSTNPGSSSSSSTSTNPGSSSSTSSSSSTNPGSSSSSSEASGCGWSSKQVRQQAAADLKRMMVPPGEQHRRQKQRECMAAAAVAAAAAGSSSATANNSTEAG